jgi:hypothetical protein
VTISDQLNLLIGLCTLILVFLLWPEKQRTSEKKPATEDNKTHSARAHHVKQRVLMFFRKPKHWYPDDSRQGAIERKYWRRQFWVSVATLMAAVGAVIIAAYTFHETQKQASAAIEGNSINREALRPFNVP